MFSTDLAPDEILVEIELPASPPRTGWSFMEVAPRAGDYALMGVAALVTLDEQGKCQRAKLVYLNAGDGPVEAKEAAKLLEGGTPGDQLIESAAALASGQEINPFGNVHTSPEFQRHLANVLTKKALKQAINARGGKSPMTQTIPVTVTVNEKVYRREVEPRLLLSDFLRHDLGLTGTHVGCEHGVCGACTILFDGQSMRSCLIFAVQANGHNITTVEGLAKDKDNLHPLQQAFWEAHGLQCGYCTPGILMTLVPFLKENPDPTEDEIRHALSGNLCRCTGYQHIVDAVKLAADKMR